MGRSENAASVFQKTSEIRADLRGPAGLAPDCGKAGPATKRVRSRLWFPSACERYVSAALQSVNATVMQEQ